MGVENLLGKGANQYIEGTRRSELDRGYTRSPLYIVASAYIKEGSEGMKTISQKLARDNIAIVPDKELIMKLPVEDRQSMTLNQAAVVFGISAISIDTILQERIYSEKEWVSRYNEAVSGTIFPTLTSVNGQDLPISQDEWIAIISSFREDETLVILFKDHFEKIPKPLQALLRSTGVLNTIQELILPHFHAQVSEQIKARREEEERRKRD